jgi:hypothetical protein
LTVWTERKDFFERRPEVSCPMMASHMARSPKRFRLAAALAIGIAGIFAVAPASAQTPEELAKLRQVFGEGRALEGKNQWAEALEKFKQVASVKMTPQVRFHIALCEENLGKLVSAMRGFDLATEEAKQAGSSAVEVATNAPPRAEALRSRIAKVTLEVSGKLSTSKIYLDEVAVAPKDLGAEIPVDPGVSHVIEVRDANGKSSFKKEITLAEKASDKVEVPVDDREAPAPPPPTDQPPPPPPPSRVPVYVTGALGAAALAGAGVFFVLRANNISAIAQNCKDQVNYTDCRPADADLVNTGKIYTGVADALLGVGIAGVGAAGVLFFVLQPKKQPAPQKASATVSAITVVPTGTGIKVIGTF